MHNHCIMIFFVIVLMSTFMQHVFDVTSAPLYYGSGILAGILFPFPFIFFLALSGSNYVMKNYIILN